jgi:thymidylate kinase
MEALPLLGLDWVFGEGARLSHMGFLTELAACTDLTVIYLQVDPEEAARRRQARGGKLLSDRYCKVATTKANNVAAACRQAGIKVLEETSGLG